MATIAELKKMSERLRKEAQAATGDVEGFEGKTPSEAVVTAGRPGREIAREVIARTRAEQEALTAASGGRAQRPLTPGETAAAIGIPTTMAVAGGVIGGALAGPPGAIVGEAVGDVGGFFVNVAQGFEEFSLESLTTAAISPLAPAAAVRVGKRVAAKTKAARFAIQETQRRAAVGIKNNFQRLQDTLDAARTEEDIRKVRLRKRALVEASEDTVKRAENLIAVQDVNAGKAFRSREAKLLPLMDQSSIDELYSQVDAAKGFVSLTELRKVQDELRETFEGVKRVIPALPEAIGALAEKSRFGIVNFQDVRRTMTQLGRRQASLAVARTPEAGEQRFIFAQLRDGLEASLERASNDPKLAPQVRRTLKIANEANFKMRTGEELSYFLEQFKDTLAEGEVIDWAKAQRKFRSERDKEATLLRSRLEKLGIRGEVDNAMTAARRIQEKAAEIKETAEEALVRARRLPEPERVTLPRQPSLVEFISPEEIEPSIFGAVFRATLGTGVPLGAGPGAPTAFGFLMLTGSGRKMMLRLLDDSKNLFDDRVAGATGALLRASLVQSTRQPEPTVSQEGVSGTPQSPEAELGTPAIVQ